MVLAFVLTTYTKSTTDSDLVDTFRIEDNPKERDVIIHKALSGLVDKRRVHGLSASVANGGRKETQ